MVIVSGIQPSGKLHVGNYLGAVKNWLALQEDKDNRCFFFIADWHSLTEDYDPKEKAMQVRELAAELLALGIGTPSPPSLKLRRTRRSPPGRGGGSGNVTLFRQSDLPEHLELAWYFACLTPVGSMERMTQYKDKLAQGESPNVGLFTYPVLMAADILAYAQPQAPSPSPTSPSGLRGTGRSPSSDAPAGAGRREGEKIGIGVPVGDDQKQHLELANDIVRRFNNRFGQTFPEITYCPAPVARVMSLKDPLKKMSKSLGGDHCLFLDDEPTEIERKIRSAVTDTGPTPSPDAPAGTGRSPSSDAPAGAGRREGEKKNSFPTPMAIGGGYGGVGMSSGVRTLFEILEAFAAPKEVTKFRKAHEAGTIKYAELKPAVAKAFAASHTEFRTKKAALMAHPDRIDAALAAGAKAARTVASETLAVVRERVGVR